VWTWEERVVIAEVKFSAEHPVKLPAEHPASPSEGKAETLLEAALNQIQENRYYEKYAGGNRRIALLGIGFAGKDIVCRMKEL
jgi:hypothetical protein